jgi:hypothetical protein
VLSHWFVFWQFGPQNPFGRLLASFLVSVTDDMRVSCSGRDKQNHLAVTTVCICTTQIGISGTYSMQMSLPDRIFLRFF